MKKHIILWIITFTAVIGGAALHHPAIAATPDAARKPAVAGRFYPADPQKLSNDIHKYMRQAEPPSGDRPIALAAPHAGYVFSGQICADALNQAAGYSYDLIVLLGVNHTVSLFPGASIFRGKGYETPLGIANIAPDAVSRFTGLCPYVRSVPAAHRREHSIEVLIPFIQTVFPDTPILPMIIGTNNPKICRGIGEALAETLQEENALIIASTDLSHYPSYKDARKVDSKTLNAMLTLDPGYFQKILRRQEAKNIPNLSTCACGEATVMAAMTAARQMGANCGRLVRYASSGDSVHGDRDRVVGYGAVAFYEDDNCDTAGDAERELSDSTHHSSPPGLPAEPEDSLNGQDKQFLLALARKTIKNAFNKEGPSAIKKTDRPALREHRGAFVTLNKHDRLRGCIGRMSADAPLYNVVREMALQAAFSDRRFPRLQENELEDINIEISVLTPFEPIRGADEIEVGRDGVMLRKAGRSAVFLPQVAPEQGWSRDEMLSHLSRKAGLSPDAWKTGAQLYIFQAIVFSESE